MTTLAKIVDLLTHQGHAQYGGESVTQLDHALQCADLARKHGAYSALITACLFHDLGHLGHQLGENAAQRGVDDRHEYRALGWLRPLFGLGVTEPIRLHVEAKRYLCATQVDYQQNLSQNSRLSLTLQGGSFSEAEAQKFLAQPYAQDAIQLRLWDEKAKVPGLKTPTIKDFLTLLPIQYPGDCGD